MDIKTRSYHVPAVAFIASWLYYTLNCQIFLSGPRVSVIVRPLTSAASSIRASVADLRDVRKELAWEPRWLDPITGGAGVLRTFLCVPVEPRSAILSSRLALHPPSPTFPLSVHGSRHKIRLCCVQACVFLGRCIHAFSSLLPLRAAPYTAATLVRVSLHPPAPKGN